MVHPVLSSHLLTKSHLHTSKSSTFFIECPLLFIMRSSLGSKIKKLDEKLTWAIFQCIALSSRLGAREISVSFSTIIEMLLLDSMHLKVSRKMMIL